MIRLMMTEVREEPPEVVKGHHGDDAGSAQGGRGVDRNDPGVGSPGPDDRAVTGLGPGAINGITGSAGHLGHGVDIVDTQADDP